MVFPGDVLNDKKSYLEEEEEEFHSICVEQLCTIPHNTQ